MIDSWCDSEGAFVKSFENDKYKFDYFGSDYVLEKAASKEKPQI